MRGCLQTEHWRHPSCQLFSITRSKKRSSITRSQPLHNSLVQPSPRTISRPHEDNWFMLLETHEESSWSIPRDVGGAITSHNEGPLHMDDGTEPFERVWCEERLTFGGQNISAPHWGGGCGWFRGGSWVISEGIESNWLWSCGCKLFRTVAEGGGGRVVCWGGTFVWGGGSVVWWEWHVVWGSAVEGGVAVRVDDIIDDVTLGSPELKGEEGALDITEMKGTKNTKIPQKLLC